MASKAKLSRITDPEKPSIEVKEQDRFPRSGRGQEIRRRAYEIYLQRGAQPGHELGGLASGRT